jgi:hypothetical protein
MLQQLRMTMMMDRQQPLAVLEGLLQVNACSRTAQQTWLA